MRRLDKDMNLHEMINNITNDPYMKEVLINNIDHERLNIGLLTLDYYEIVDDNLSYFYFFACEEDIKEFFDTIALLRLGIFSKSEILNNIESDNIIPFIDKTIKMDDNMYKSDYLKWKKYLYDIKESFNKRKEIITRELK